MNSQTSIALISLSLIVGAAGAQSTQAVEWKVSEGGNGHWYASTTNRQTWTASRTFAISLGADLASIHSVQENEFVKQTVPPNTGTGYNWIGLRRTGGVWEWSSGETATWFAWHPDEPNGTGDQFVWLYTCCGSIPVASYSVGLWNDTPVSANDAHTAIIEWSADCNGDGIVDYGQIKSGQLDDDNGDGIPDACQYSVTGVIPVSGASSGGTAITIKGANFPENPVVRVGGVLATDVVRVSATRITAVTPAGLPGMTSVTVGNWVQPNAFYYRPECGSDLDQNGEVDAGDIAIILLDFGPCYATPTATQPEDSRPFMLREQSASAGHQAN